MTCHKVAQHGIKDDNIFTNSGTLNNASYECIRSGYSPFRCVLSPPGLDDSTKACKRPFCIPRRCYEGKRQEREKKTGKKNNRTQKTNAKSCFLLIYILVSKVLTLILPVPVFQEEESAWEIHHYKVASFRSWVKHPLPRGPGGGRLLGNCLHAKPYNLTHTHTHTH